MTQKWDQTLKHRYSDFIIKYMILKYYMIINVSTIAVHHVFFQFPVTLDQEVVMVVNILHFVAFHRQTYEFKLSYEDTRRTTGRLQHLRFLDIRSYYQKIKCMVKMQSV